MLCIGVIMMVGQTQSVEQMTFLSKYQSTKVDYLRALVNFQFQNKKTFLGFLSQEFSIKIPKRATYLQISKIIISKGYEKKFSNKIADVNDFDCLVAGYDIVNGLSAFSSEELLEIAECLRKRNPKWKLKKTSMKELITSISVIAGREEIQTCLNELFLRSVKEKGSFKSVRQNERWTVGPYGILRSTYKRSTSVSNDLMRFFNKDLNRAAFIEFLKVIEIPSNIIPSKNDPLLVQKSIQLIFSSCDDNLIFNTLNSLIDNELIKIDSSEKYWNFYATPCGLFKETYGEVDDLAKLLIKEIPEKDLDIELNKEEIRDGTLKMRVLELCLRKNPSIILSDLFGFPALRRIARNFSFISVDNISDRKKLIDLILLKLGFKIPPILIGINQYQEKLLDYRAQIQTSIRKREEKIGIMTDIYSQTERILKDLIYFYSANIWADEILSKYEPEEKLEAAESIIMKKVNNDREIQKASFGKLIQMLRNINNLVNSDERIKKKFIQKFHRSELLDRSHFQALDEVSPYRSRFTHDKKDKQVTNQNCLDIINTLSNLVSDLQEKSVYPNFIRISREITNEYGVNYVEAIDEKGKKWTIKTNEWIETELSYFMISKTKPIAIEPIIIEKFW